MTTTSRPRSPSRRPTRGDEEVWDSRRRHPTARPIPGPRASRCFVGILVTIATLSLIGFVMVLSASSVFALDRYGSSWYVAMRHGLWLAIGTLVAVAAMRIDYHRWRRWASPAYLASVVLLALVFVPGAGVSANGATRWLGYGPLSLQPSELVKLTLLVVVADLLARRTRHTGNLRLTLVPATLLFALVALLVMAQPNLGTTLVLAAILGALLWVSGVPAVPLTGMALAGASATALLALWAPYRRARVLAFLDPWESYADSGYQSIQSLVGVASGGLTGTGLGESRAKWGFLPEAHTDFIFAIIGEELGLLGALVVVLCFAALCWFGARAALLAPDRFGMLLAAGITVWFGTQAVVNIGAVIGILPITGVPLPFVSYGGSSLLFTMAASGLLLNVARHARPVERRRTTRSGERRASVAAPA